MTTFRTLYNKILNDKKYTMNNDEIKLFACEMNNLANKIDKDKDKNSPRNIELGFKITYYWGMLQANQTNLYNIHPLIVESLFKVLEVPFGDSQQQDDMYNSCTKDNFYTGIKKYPNGDVYHFVNGAQHRIGGPAVVYANGSAEEYWINDELVSKEAHDLLYNMMKLKDMP